MFGGGRWDGWWPWRSCTSLLAPHAVSFAAAPQRAWTGLLRNISCLRLPVLSALRAAEGMGQLAVCFANACLCCVRCCPTEGMDFAAHNVTLSWMASQGKLG